MAPDPNEKVVQSITGRPQLNLPRQKTVNTFSLAELQNLGDLPEKETCRQRSNGHGHQDNPLHKPTYEDIACRVINPLARSFVHTCSKDCDNRLSNNNVTGGCFLSNRLSRNCGACEGIMKSVKEQLIQDMRTVMVGIKRIDSPTLPKKIVTGKQTKESNITKITSFKTNVSQKQTDEKNFNNSANQGQKCSVAINRSLIEPQIAKMSSSNNLETAGINSLVPPGTPRIYSPRVTRSRSRENQKTISTDKKVPMPSNKELDSKLLLSQTSAGTRASSSKNMENIKNRVRQQKTSDNGLFNNSPPPLPSQSRSRTNASLKAPSKDVGVLENTERHEEASKNELPTKFSRPSRSRTNASLKAPSKDVGVLENTERHEASKNELPTKFSRPSRSRTKPSCAPLDTKIIKENLDGTEVIEKEISLPAPEIPLTFRDCSIVINKCSIPAFKTVHSQDQSLKKGSKGPSKTDSKSHGTLMADEPSLKRTHSESGFDTSRFGRVIKKVKLTPYDATPNFISSLQQRSALLRTSKALVSTNRKNLSHFLKEYEDKELQPPETDEECEVSISESDDSYWQPDSYKKKKPSQKLNKVPVVTSKRKFVHGQTKKKASSKQKTEAKSHDKSIKTNQTQNSGSMNISNDKNSLREPSAAKTSATRRNNPTTTTSATRGRAIKTKEKSSSIIHDEKLLPKGDKKASQRKKSNKENVDIMPEVGNLVTEKEAEKAIGTTEGQQQSDVVPDKVTAKKGTLKYLKQRQKRQEYLLKKQQENGADDDFFDDVEHPQINNFHKSKYRISDNLLDSPTTGADSTSMTSFNLTCDSLYTPTSSPGGGGGGGAYTPRTALLARFGGGDDDGRGWMVNTPSTSSQGDNMGVNIGLAITPGSILPKSVANRIIYNNRKKRSLKRMFASCSTQPTQPELGSTHSNINSQTGACKARFDGSLSQSPNTSAAREIVVEYEYSPGARKNKYKRIKLPVLDNDGSEEEAAGWGSDVDNYF